MAGVNKAQRALLDEAVAVAGRSRELFPYGGFEDLDGSEIQILLCVVGSPGDSVLAISKKLRFEQPTMSRPISKLVDKDLIEVEVDPNDGRRKLIKPTRSGVKITERYLKSVA